MDTYKILSAGIVPFRRDSSVVYFLLLRAFRYWDFPKGEVLNDEDPFDAAIRELREETSISEISFPFGRRYYETETYANRKVARYHLAEVMSADVILLPNKGLGRPEHHEYRWISAPNANLLLGSRVAKVLKWAVELLQ